MLNKLKNRLKEIRDYRVIKRSGLFDREYYLRNNLDVARSCMNPIMHYIRHGWHEGRNPSAKFNSSSYLKKNYKDVMGAGINPLVHYIRYEKKEGREPCNIIFEPSQKDTFHAKNLTLENGKKFTIIMPTWNRREVICRAIDSILAQSYQNFELIISDDGSTDGTMSMVKEKYAHELNSGRIRYLYHKHTGVSSARNAAARIAKGEWIAYLDTDDTWREHFLLMMASAFIENPAYKTAYSQFTIHDRVQGIDYTVKTPFNSSLIRRQNFISMIVYAHHREVYEECGVFDENLTRYTDWDMIIRHTAVFKPLYIPYVLADYERIKTLNNITFSESHEENQKLLDEKNRNALQRIAIKIPVPDREQAHKWGDYHLTYALQRGLRKAGFTVRTDVLSEWYYPETDQDDIVIVIRGLSSYEPKPHQRNIMWNISHPNKIPLEEYNKYDLVLVASNTYAKFLQANCDVPVYVMLQFTDLEMFFYEPSDELTTDLLFVGNSRKQYRKAVRACVERGIDVDVYGTLWEGIIPEHYIKGQFIRYKELHRYYCSAKIILNDHWDSMRQYGFISNRIYDVAASGGFILSDDCQGIADAFDGCIAIYTDAGDLIHKIEYYLKNPESG